MISFTRALIRIILFLTFAPLSLADIVLSTPAGIEVTQEDIEHYIVENVPPSKREALRNPELYKKMAESIYLLRVLAVEAEALPSYDPAQAAWSARVKQMRELVQVYRQEYIAATFSGVSWEAAAREAYIVEKARFVTKEKVQASHILITSGDTRNEDEALELATQLHGRIIAGEDFAELAKEYSDDKPTGERGGDLGGMFERNRMVGAFEEVVFSMKEIGEISDVVTTSFGHHIIKLTARQEAGAQLPFDEVKDQLVNEVLQKRSKQLWNDKLIALRSAPDLQYNEIELQELAEKYKDAENIGDPAAAAVVDQK
ncbi:MAG: hypothetical protein HOC23_11960 [Halieaceae bacterium]|nr:hypothetical protein [Halieaceae bacterium]